MAISPRHVPGAGFGTLEEARPPEELHIRLVEIEDRIVPELVHIVKVNKKGKPGEPSGETRCVRDAVLRPFPKWSLTGGQQESVVL